eukprot:10646730-Ditylum_brightwellii.AAC.1
MSEIIARLNEIKRGEIARQWILVVKDSAEVLTKHFCTLFIRCCFCPIMFAHVDHATLRVMVRESFLQGPHCLPRLNRVRA